jgi:hypothetical protein
MSAKAKSILRIVKLRLANLEELIAGHWSANAGWVLKRPFHAGKKDANTLITI